MRIHRNLCLASAEILRVIFSDGRYADIALEKAFRSNRQWGARDRRFIAEIVYGVVRWRRKLWWALDEEENLNEKSLLRLVGSWLVVGETEIPEWIGILEDEKAKIKKRFEDPVVKRCVRESIPDWLDELGQKELGTPWPKRLSSLNEQAKVYLRANTLKTDRAKLIRALEKEDILTDPVELVKDALVLQKRANVFITESYKKGLFEVQDAASQLVAPLVDAQPGMRVVDACAGAGGKSLHLAALMENKGKIISMDIHEGKLEELKKRAKRAGAGNIETRPISSSKTIKRMKEGADRVLLDVPCSGLGVLKRSPDTKWKLTSERLDELSRVQQEILSKYSQMVRSGGKLVYATCSILPQENEKQIEWFLEESSASWKVESQWHSNPEENGFDGFYAAVLVRS